VIYHFAGNDLSKGFRNIKRKLEVIMHFSEKIELILGKKMPHVNITVV